MEKMKSCCFTGHRPQKLSWGLDEEHPDCISLKSILKEQIERMIEKGVCTFITGMAIGTDIWAAEIVLDLKRAYPHIQLIAAIPHEGQERSWSEKYKARYAVIRANANQEFVLHEHYTRSCMHERNRYMVDNSAHMIAVFNGEKGGSKETIDYAKRKGLEIIIINPDDMSITL